VLVAFTARFGGQFYQNRLVPPHRVSAAVERAIEARGLTHVVVAMPGNNPSAMPPIDTRAGLAFMAAPLEDNPVIYVRIVPGWQGLAAESFPGRPLYQVSADPQSPTGFRIDRVTP
jgi:hypothetical protein